MRWKYIDYWVCWAAWLSHSLHSDQIGLHRHYCCSIDQALRWLVLNLWTNVQGEMECSNWPRSKHTHTHTHTHFATDNCLTAVISFSLKTGPLEAILVIFGRRALNFFLFESSWKKKEKWHHFCVHAQWWSPWRRKNVEKGHLAPSNLTFLLFAIDTNGFRRMKEEG